MSNSTESIPLSKRGKYAGLFCAIVSLEDVDLAAFNWTVINPPKRNTQYARRNIKTATGQKTTHLHRVIMERILGRKLLSSEEVDHIDMNGLNNCRSNLRLAPNGANRRNRKKHSNNTSGYKGVTWDKFHKKWAARIHANQKSIHLGFFHCREDAFVAYCEAADKYHQEYANHGE